MIAVFTADMYGRDIFWEVSNIYTIVLDINRRSYICGKIIFLHKVMMMR